MLNWMAWTWPTALVFIGIFSAMLIITVIEIKRPGTSERYGILRITTTRGDRLFLSLLGTTYIFLFWIGVFGFPLWAPLGISVVWSAFCFVKV